MFIPESRPDGSLQLVGGIGTRTGPACPVWHLSHWTVQSVEIDRLSERSALTCDPYGVALPVAFPDGQTTVGPLPPGPWQAAQEYAGLWGLVWHPPLAPRQF